MEPLLQPKRREAAVRCEVMAHRVHPSIAQLVLTVAGLALAAVPCLAEQPAQVELTALYSFLSSEAPDGDNLFHGLRSDLTVYRNRYFGLGATSAIGDRSGIRTPAKRGLHPNSELTFHQTTRSASGVDSRGLWSRWPRGSR